MIISQNMGNVTFLFILVTFQAGIITFLTSIHCCPDAHWSVRKFVNECVSRIGCRINTTEPNHMILVSFFSEDNVLSDKIKICYIFEFQSNENRAFRFFGTAILMELTGKTYIKSLISLLWGGGGAVAPSPVALSLHPNIGNFNRNSFASIDKCLISGVGGTDQSSMEQISSCTDLQPYPPLNTLHLCHQ